MVHCNKIVASIFLSAAVLSMPPAQAGHLLDPAEARTQLKDQLLSSIDAVKREVQTTADNPIFSETTAGMMVLGIVLPILMGSFDTDSSGTKMIEDLLRANGLDHILDSDHMLNRSETAILFEVAPGLCNKIALALNNNDETSLNSCKQFLLASKISLQLEKKSDYEMRLSLHYNLSQHAANDFVLALDVSTTSLSMEFKLDAIHRFLDSVRQMKPESSAFPDFRSIRGITEVSVRFNNEGRASGCHDNASICLTLNVLDPLLIDYDSDGSHSTIEWAASPANAPAMEFGGNGGSSFFLRLNVGKISAKFGSSTNLHIPALVGDVVVPKHNAEDEVKVELRDLSVGQGAMTFTHGDNKFSFELNRDANHVLKALNFVWNEVAGMFLNASHLDLRMNFVDDGMVECKSNESVRFSLNPAQHSQARVKLNFDNLPESKEQGLDCRIDILVNFFKLNLLSNIPCGSKNAIEVQQGKIEYEQSYEVNKVTGGGAWQASEGQCIGTLPTDPSEEKHDDL